MSVQATRSRLAKALVEGVPQGSIEWTVRRAWPADLNDPAAGVVLELARRTARAGATIVDGDLVLQSTDPVLGALPPGQIIGLRPHKRAVVRSDDGRFVKVARSKATRRAVARAAAVEDVLRGVPDAPARPTIAAVGRNRIVLDPAPGVDLRSFLSDVASGRAAVTAQSAGRQVAGVLTALSRVAPGDQTSSVLPSHTPADEAAVLQRWADAALALAPMSRQESDRLWRRVPEVTSRLHRSAGRTARPGLVHRDVHDGQVLLDDTGVTLLDWDTASWADPTIDVANLLAHLEYSARLGHTDRQATAAFTTAFTTELRRTRHPASRGAGLLELLLEATDLRMLAVHAFRRPPAR